ncbi:MAG: Gfo/Idh/MocA family oxidoreductase, partial [Acidimicrobiaceae bacterium]|nr:Gfo/Idh/MocA family oxidoreductase [Acidimicrobiaceae bacterium]
MTSVGIVGAGRAATLHAEAVRAVRGVRLAGVTASSTTSPRAAALAGALDCPVLTTQELARTCDVAVVATPPVARAGVLADLASSRRLRAVLVESPAATTLDGIADLTAGFMDRPGMAAVNLLHAPVVRRTLDAIATMDPHHLELRLAVPDPARGPDSGSAFGGGVLMDPAAGFWPVMIAAMGAAVETVAVPRIEVADGLDRAAEVMLRAVNGRTARASLRWGSRVAEAAVEAADSAHVAPGGVWARAGARGRRAPAGPPPGAGDPPG